MAQILWDQSTKRLYETGVDHGVLYTVNTLLGTYSNGFAWNGLTAVTESPSGAEASPQYADNIKYLNIMSLEEFGATVEAFTYPKEFALCDGSAEPTVGVMVGQQDRMSFGLAYRTVLGNDVEGNSYGYKLHLIYGCKAAPSEKSYATINDSPEAITFSWEITTTPIPVTGYRATSSIVIDSTLVDATKLGILEDILFGTAGADPRLPLPDEVISILTEAAPSAVSMTLVPADDAANVAVSASVVITFNNAIAAESITLASAAGVIVPAAKSWNADAKILTVNPTNDLTAATVYLVSISGVVDIYGQSLAATVTNFETAA